MPTIDELQKAHEAAIDQLLGRLGGRGSDSDWALVRALCHRAIHLCAERKAADYCAVATFLAEMIGHAHALQHDGARGAASHDDRVH